MLQKLNFKPGYNKQDTESGAEGQWVDGDFVRFRYGLPEKIGGWQQLTAADHTLPGAARKQHAFSSFKGEKYTAIGTSQGLFLYYGEAFYDITPLDTAITGATFDTVEGSSTVTVNKGSHGLAVGRYITFTGVVTPNGFTSSTTFTEGAFEILTVPTDNTFTIQTPIAAVAGATSGTGGATINPYIIVGPTTQTVGYGWGTYLWGNSTWGTERSTSNVVLVPGNWSLDNFGEVLVATIFDGRTFTWNAGAAGPRDIRASQSTTNFNTTNNPTATRISIVSDRDRHLFHLGTETTIGDASTQDPMFVRFSNQEDLNTYAPTATNTAGSFRLDTGNEIRAAIQGKDYIFVTTDLSAYVIQFVGPPFTFSVRQVGTNCGCIGQHAMSYANGAVWWMSGEGGFFVYDGTVKSLPCLVEDFVYSTDGDNLGLNYDSADVIYSAPNSLYTEINWFYPKAGSSQIDRCVTYNYSENVFTTSSLDRTTYQDQGVFQLPHATDYNDSTTPVFPDISGITNKYGASIYYCHEKGDDQVNSSGTTSIDAFIQSGDYDITSRKSALGQATGVVDYRGDGEFFMSVKRFIPDFKYLRGDATVTLFVSSYPDDTAVSSPLGPFTITNSTDKVDTRARGRLVSLKISNDAVGESWRYGTLRVDAQPDGRR
jgi:hypothetical protein|tara:strand:+ start:7030 stop:8994 length:1965 start_codon:yes stop_codon:yes gene_type:complete